MNQAATTLTRAVTPPAELVLLIRSGHAPGTALRLCRAQPMMASFFSAVATFVVARDTGPALARRDRQKTVPKRAGTAGTARRTRPVLLQPGR